MTAAPLRIQPVILCGGSGTRLWPLSRKHMPKQFLALNSERSLLQETLLRLGGGIFAPPLLVAAEESRFTVADQALQLGLEHPRILLEAAPRGTAPAATLAALAALQEADDALLLFAPADHAIRQPEALRQAIAEAAPAAKAGHLIAFGIQPTAPETGYGYICAGEELPGLAPARRIARFVEKPPLDVAEKMLAEGSHYWNSGIFLFGARAWLAEIGKFEPAILAACEAAMQTARTDLDFIRPDAAAFAACPAQSIDRGVMERTEKAATLAFAAGWSDVGNWAALWDLAGKDENGNAVRGAALIEESSGCYILSDGPLVAALGVSDLVIVATDDAVLVAPLKQAQKVGALVERLRQAGHAEADASRTDHRPWGRFRRIEAGPGFQAKLIEVKPGAALSLQLHHKRAEHWVVVQGQARVTRGEEIFLLEANQSTFIPLGMKHRLENPGDVSLVVIEIQSGSYLGEDDIIRFEDNFGRS